MALTRIQEGPHGLRNILLYSYAEAACAPLIVRRKTTAIVASTPADVLEVVDAGGVTYANAIILMHSDGRRAAEWLADIASIRTGVEHKPYQGE